MKKTIFILLALSLVFGLMGCSKSNMTEYSNAVKKTAELKKGEELLEIKIKNEFDLSKFTEEGKMIFGLFEDISLSAKGKIDKNQKKQMVETNLKIAGFNTDFNLYALDDKFYIEIINPVVNDKKYIEFDQAEQIIVLDDDVPQIGLSEDTIKKIKDKWLDMVSEENIFKGKNILITTDSGEVKATEYTININHEQFIELSSYVIDTIIANRDIHKILESEEGFSSEKINNLFNIVKYRLENAIDLGYNYKAFIDKDGYIVEQNMEFVFLSDQIYGLPISKSEISIKSQILNLGKTPKFEFEEPNENNTIKIEDMMKGIDMNTLPILK